VLALYYAWVHYLPYAYAVSHMAQTGSVYTTVAVTLERFLAIGGTSGSTPVTNTGALLTTLAVCLFSIAFNFSKFWEISLDYVAECTGFAALGLTPGPLLENDTYGKVYSLWLTNIVMVFAPFVALLLFNSVILIKIRRARDQYKEYLVVRHEQTREMGRQRRRHSQVARQFREQTKDATLVLVIIVLIFLVCNFWGFVITLMEHIYGRLELQMSRPIFYAFSREAINFLGAYMLYSCTIPCWSFRIATPTPRALSL